VAGDGNCLARAIVASRLTRYQDYKELKAAALHFVRRNQEIVLHGLDREGIDPEALKRIIHYLENDGAWADSETVNMFATFLDKEIQVWDSFSGVQSHTFPPRNTFPEGLDEPIYVAYRSANEPIYDSERRLVARTQGHFDGICYKSVEGNGQSSVPDRR
jgi:hypothetical protein